MSQGPGGPPTFGPPPFQSPPFQPPPGPGLPPGPPGSGGPPAPGGPAQASDAPTGTTRLLVLVTAGLGVVLYILGFLGGSGSWLGALLGLMLVGGGLLTGASVLPGVGRRVLLPGSIAVLVGALLLLQGVVGGGAPGVVILGLIVAVVQAAAAVGAFLMDIGVIATPVRPPAHVPTRQGPPQGFNQPNYPPPGFGGPAAFGPPPGSPQGSPFGGPPAGGPPTTQTGGWGQGPVPPLATQGASGAGSESTGSVPDRTVPREDMSATTAIPIVTGDATPIVTGDSARTTRAKPDDASSFGEGSMFGETTVTRRGQEQTERPSSTAVPMPSNGHVAPERPAVRPTDETGVFEEGAAFQEGGTYQESGGMFTESTPSRHTSEPSAEGRHEQPGDDDRPDRKGAPPEEQTWFLPPGDRPPN